LCGTTLHTWFVTTIRSTETINFLASQRTATASASSFTMVQGLAFLSKKSWHTKNLNNQEKVWVAEERKNAEARKTQELQKQIQQELEQQELDAIAGRTSRRDRGIDWMYEHGPTSETARMDSEKKSEEYLLGKEFVPEGAPKGDLDVDKAQDGVNKVVSSASAAAAAASYSREDASGTEHAPELSVKERNEAFTLRFEDPMFMVARRAVDIERKLERKKQLLERVTGAVAVDLADVDIKRKKEKKKKRDRGDKKPTKKRRRSLSVDSPSDDSGRSEGRRYRKKSPPRKRDRSSSPESHDRGRNHRPDLDGRRSHSRKHQEKGSSRYDRNRSESPKDYRYESRKLDRRSRSRSLSPSPQRDRRSCHKLGPDDEPHGRTHSSRSDRFDSRREDRSRERDRRYQPDVKHDAPDRHEKHHEFRDHRFDDRKLPPSSHANSRDAYRDSDRRYGLQGASKLDDRRPGKLGPDEELLRKRRCEREEQKRQMEQAARRRRMTPEERAKALEEMEANARTYDSHRASKLRGSGHREGDDDTTNNDDSRGANREAATFLNDIQRRAYGVDQGISMQERLQQNRNSHQRSHDSNFL
jgi:N-terminal domain of CBF1 interacting co-repressor CIR